jgi:hypothetical protein
MPDNADDAAWIGEQGALAMPSLIRTTQLGENLPSIIELEPGVIPEVDIEALVMPDEIPF